MPLLVFFSVAITVIKFKEGTCWFNQNVDGVCLLTLVNWEGFIVTKVGDSAYLDYVKV